MRGPTWLALSFLAGSLACRPQPSAALVLDRDPAAELGLAEDRVNVNGGGIALGHPIGASGNRLVVHAVHELLRRGSGTAAVALCGGGGQGEALILTR